MAPELHSPKSVGLERFVRTYATDVYAFACICVEVSHIQKRIALLFDFISQVYSGKAPFYELREDAAVLLRVIKGGRPTKPSGTPGRVMPDQLWNIVKAAWHQQPSKRLSITAVLRRFRHDYLIASLVTGRSKRQGKPIEDPA